MFPSLLEQFDKFIVEEFTRPKPSQAPTLQQSTIRTVQQQEDDRIKQEFDDFERKHYVVGNEEYLSMLGCVEAYKDPASRNQFLDNTTIYRAGASNDRIAVYERGMYSIRSLYICIHGTKLTSVEDIIQDILVLENSVLNSPFTIRIIQDIINIRRQFNYIANDNIYISGHSLGAVYSLLGSKILNTNGYGFNGASSLINLQLLSGNMGVMDMTYDLKNIENYQNYVSYRIAGDPISLLSKWTLRNVETINVEGVSDLTPLQKHSMKTFVDICIPIVPLQTGSLSRARRSGRLDDSREQIPQEGQQMELLRQQTQTTPLGQLLEIVEQGI